MAPTLRARLVLLFGASLLTAVSACGARSVLDDTPSSSPGTGGGSSTGGATTTTTSSSSGTTTTSSSTSSTSSSTSSTSSTSGTAPVISKSPGSFIQSETSVAVSSDGHVAVAWIDIGMTGNSSIGYTFSTDDGASFGPVVKLKSPGGRLASDPTVVVDAAQNFWVAWVGYHVQGMSPTDMHIYVAEAPAGSTKFGTPIEVSDPMDTSLYDKPWITVTNTGALVVTYERDAMPADFALMMARSADGGGTWQRSTIAEDQSGNIFRNLAFPCAPPDGSRLWVTYLAFGNVLDVRLAYSDDGGVTWSTETVVSAVGEQVAFDDPTCVAEKDEVWISYGLTQDMIDPSAENADKLYAIRLAHSGDGGSTIDTRIDAHDQNAPAKYFMHPQIAREAGGAIDLVYYAGLFDQDTDGSYRRSRAESPVSGFAPSVVIETPVTFLQSRSDPRWLGDYTGIFIRGSELYTSFAVNDTGTAEIAFAKAMVP